MLRNLTPDLIVNQISEVSLDGLAQRGIEALLIDLDNTICPWHSEELHPPCREWIEAARDRFRICLVSNSIKPKRLNRIAERLGIPAVGRWGLGRKPFKGGLTAALRELDIAPERAAMIGDQIMTDVLGGNRVGVYTVWVQPLQSKEFFGTKFGRMVEALLVKRFEKMGLMPRAPVS